MVCIDVSGAHIICYEGNFQRAYANAKDVYEEIFDRNQPRIICLAVLC